MDSQVKSYIYEEIDGEENNEAQYITERLRNIYLSDLEI